jgi:hypothetical protein
MREGKLNRNRRFEINSNPTAITARQVGDEHRRTEVN